MKRYSRIKITSKKLAKFFFLKTSFSAYQRTFECGYIQSSHIHDFPQIWLCISGVHKHEVAGVSHTCRRGDFLIIPPGIPHSFKLESGDVKMYCIDLSPDIFLNFDDLITVGKLFLPSEKLCVRLSKDSMHTTLEILKSLREENLKASLSALFSLPEFDIKVSETSVNERILPILHALSYINNNFSQKITIEDMLLHTALCRTNFLRYLKALTGSSFSAYLQEVRLAYAFVLIGNSNYPLSHIATLCGFSDAYYMTNCYKKYIGKSPNIERPAVREDFDAVKKTYKFLGGHQNEKLD